MKENGYGSDFAPTGSQNNEQTQGHKVPQKVSTDGLGVVLPKSVKSRKKGKSGD